MLPSARRHSTATGGLARRSNSTVAAPPIREDAACHSRRGPKYYKKQSEFTESQELKGNSSKASELGWGKARAVRINRPARFPFAEHFLDAQNRCANLFRGR
eukprot:GHVT01001153.1.p1 GENE.GHVT01001153.1~~GHVT01001153.1.p1  ORF type:complete len:102 (-),score=14.30 GHVT01001153.1:130-435(-)